MKFIISDLEIKWLEIWSGVLKLESESRSEFVKFHENIFKFNVV